MDNFESVRDYLKPSRIQRQKRRDKRLHKELVECYRGGGDWVKGSSRKHLLGRDFEFAMQKERMKLPYRRGLKYPSDYLNPLKRLLNRSVGRPWNDVWSELSQRLDRRSALGLHVYQHLEDYVAMKVIIVNGHVFRKASTTGRLRHLYWYSSASPSFYVHPETGILLRAPYYNWRNRSRLWGFSLNDAWD